MKGSGLAEWEVQAGFLLMLRPSPKSLLNKSLQNILYMETPVFAIPDHLGQMWSEVRVQDRKTELCF